MMEQNEKMQLEISQLQNALLYMSQALENLGKGHDVLARVMKNYEGGHTKTVEALEEAIVNMGKSYKNLSDGCHEQFAYITSKLSALEAKANLLVAEIEKFKKVQNPEVYNKPSLPTLPRSFEAMGEKG